MTPSGRRLLLAGLAVVLSAAAFASGLYVGGRGENDRPSFHDMRVNHVVDLVDLVNPVDPDVRSLAMRLGTPEAAYLFVRDRIRYESGASAAAPDEIIRDGFASCLGKATLLCSLYRAMGIRAEDVRVVTGSVILRDGLAEHAWIDLEYGGGCLQQDPSGFLGSFEFSRFRDDGFTRAFVFEEEYCFNEDGFAVVSQLNRFRKDLPGRMGGAP